MGLDTSIRDAVRPLERGDEPGRPRAEEFDLRRLAATLWRSKFLILACTCLGIALAVLHLARTPPLFTAATEVLWEVNQPNIVDIDPVASTGLGREFLLLQSQLEIVQSSRLVGKVVDRTGLMAEPYFNPFALPPEERRISLLSRAAIDRALATIGVEIGLAGATDPPIAKQREFTIDELRRHMSVRWIDNSYVMVIAVSAPDAALSARLANAVAEGYILDQLEKKFDATRQATTWLSERVAELRTELETAESRVEEFAAGSELISEEALGAQAVQIKEMRDRRGDLAARLEAAEAEEAAIERLRAAGDFAGIADLLRRPDLVALAGEVADAPSESARAAAMAGFDRALGRLRAASRQGAERLAAQVSGLARSIAALEDELGGQSDALVQLRQLQREAEASRLIYESFLSRLKETSVQEGIQQPDARTLSDAWVPGRPSSPNHPAILGIGLIAGIAAGVSLVVLRERLNTTFRTAGDLEERTGQAVLGSIPIAALPRRQALIEFIAKRPGSSFAEAIRNLRTSVLLANVDKPPQVIMVSSGVPAEGKTTTCIALAQISRMLGKSVVVIECDLRRRNFRRYFGIEHEFGLLSVLAGNRRYDETVHVEDGSGMHVLAGEKSPVNAADVFASQRFADFLRELRQHYDFIFIDTPPVLAVPDARVIAQYTDALIYVVRWNRTPRETVTQGLRTFQQVNAKVTGCVLTQVDMKDMARYGYRAYSYYRENERYYQ